MADEYQRGSDEDWAKVEADELRHQLKKRERQLNRERMLTILLLAALGWIAYKFLQNHQLSELWQL